LLDLKFDFHNGQITAILCDFEVLSIFVAYEEGGDLGEMAVAVILHDNRRGFSFLIIVDNDQISPQILSMDHLLCELANSPLDQHDDSHVGIFVINVGFSFDTTECLTIREANLPDEDLAIGDVAKVREGVFDEFRESFDSALG
jgi:hypothetical protein